MAGSATAIGHPMQALVKYHGLRDWQLRLPYHDSVSVNIDSLSTETTVEFGEFDADSVVINGSRADPHAQGRVLAVVNRVRGLAGLDSRVRVTSVNSLAGNVAKGLGFSAAAGAALAMACYHAADLNKRWGMDWRMLSRLARLLAGSAARSVVGEYARWYAGQDDESSYAERIAGRENLDLAMVIVPLAAGFSTEEAHRDAERSPFFAARVTSAQQRVEEMVYAVRQGDLRRVGELAETDTLELHSITMTGPRGLMVYRPESVMVMSAVRGMREQGIPVYFSMQTGPSVFVNTFPEYVGQVTERLRAAGIGTLTARVGGPARLVST